ncbi:prephenate dehydrogenase [Oleiagrimonas sp. C23AA]|uniref:prephenate dehydrogenase n=1 Tax=Oleiagrimonas sp. C23AA TaxID=2719047 RepID=UPI00142150F6|nr:prephenate dehydrogenase [Oleiagrimonas sp. C23AA]NII09870.1 prephenate dehydrogenase [Oleiagrimonas sp. C23AA]
MSASKPVIGIVGNAGAYGRWLQQFFVERMGLTVVGRDPGGDESLSERALVQRSDVLVFSAPIRHTPALIAHYVDIASGAEADQLWLDITSIKSTPVAAMLASKAEVVGLHPMCAPPKAPTLKGYPMAVCQARLARWRPWLEAFLAASQARCVTCDPQRHDQAMALVQGMVHASHMAQAATWRELAPAVGGLDALAAFATVGYELDRVTTTRMLAGNPAIYQDIQFENPHVAPMLARLGAHLQRLIDDVSRGDEAAREDMRAHLLADSAAYVGSDALATGSHAFEQLGYLRADLDEPCFLSVWLPRDRAGSLRELLSVFESRGITLDSIHSSRTAAGRLHFRIGFDAGTPRAVIDEVALAIEEAGIGQVLASGAR